MIYVFDKYVADMDKYKQIKESTKLDSNNDVGELMIESAFGYIKKLYKDFGVILYTTDEMRCVGSLIYSVNPNNCIIHKMGVTNEFRRKGIGRALINELKEIIKPKSTIYLYTIDEPGVIKFYLACGFDFANQEMSKMICVGK